jgi:hypothetical protein
LPFVGDVGAAAARPAARAESWRSARLTTSINSAIFRRRSLAVAGGDRMIDTVRDMFAQYLFLDPAQRRARCRDLGNDVDARLSFATAAFVWSC